jgi:hypothetical protein
MILRKKGYTLTRLTTTPEFICRIGWAGSTMVLPFLFAKDTARSIFTSPGQERLLIPMDGRAL